MLRVISATVCALALTVSPGYADPPCYGPGDVDGDATVGLGDLEAFAECMAGPDASAPPGCDPNAFGRADLDDDGDADLQDFAGLMLHAGDRYFDYGPQRENLEAEMLAMDVSGKLRAPDAEYERILRDMALIRATYAQLVTVVDDPDYVSNELIVGVDDAQPLDDYHRLNDYYLVTDEEIHTSFRLLTFCDNLNAPVLAPIYAALSEVEWADPNWWIGIDDYITIEVLGAVYRYNIDDGFWDCFDGCDCHRQWVIDVDEAGNVMLVSYDEWGMSWCEFGGD
jgi:hypothetical protein